MRVAIVALLMSLTRTQGSNLVAPVWLNKTEEIETKIVNGLPVDDIRHANFYVKIFIRSPNGDRFCGGSLLTDKHILTAAHCVANSYNCYFNFGKYVCDPIFIIRSFKVCAGSNLCDENSGQCRDIPDRAATYHFSWNEATFYNDIAVIRLSDADRFILGPSIGVIHLPDTCVPCDYYRRKCGTIVGCGRTGTDEDRPSILHQSVICSIPDEHAKEILREDYVETALYALGRLPDVETTGACFGDSGGPLWYYDSRYGAIQYGISSHLHESCEVGFPQGFTDICRFRKWIDSILALPTPDKNYTCSESSKQYY